MVTPFERAIGYTFCDRQLLAQALTHRSRASANNERLEFLGDSLLGFFISETLVERFPESTEGELSRAKASLVRQESLAILARQFALGDALLLGSGEMKSGGFRRASILADTLEAIVAAIYLDAGVETCRQIVLSWFAAMLADVRPGEATKDPKTTLQEYLQGRGQPLPEYTVLSIEGKAHEEQFTVSCRCAGLPGEDTTGQGENRRQAEQRAAQVMLQRLQGNHA